MLTPNQIMMIKFMKNEGRIPRTISRYLEIPISQVNEVLYKPKRKSKPKYNHGKLVYQIRGEYSILLKNGYKKMYAIGELSRLHNLSTYTIRKIVLKKAERKVKFDLEVSLNIEGNSCLKQGKFTAKKEEDIPLVAYEFIKKNGWETGYRNAIIEKVIINGDQDITDKVKQIDAAPLKGEIRNE